PAERAGLRGGDVLLRLADQPIDDVYAYTEILAGLKADVPVAVHAERDGEAIDAVVTPEAR
ncbi:MAG: hypothetical protein ACREK7_03205, partial [Gemmatimonadota bacterium]